MDDEKILKDLDNNETLTYAVDMTQDRLDKLIDYCIDNNLKEKAFRLALSFPNFDYFKLAKYYVKQKEINYLFGLLHLVYDKRISDIYNEVLNTNDPEFIDAVQVEFMCDFGIYDINDLEVIIDNYK